MKRTWSGALSLGLTLAAMLVVAPAGAAPSTAQQTVDLTCANGSQLAVQVDARGLPTRNGWIDGRAVVARAFARIESGTLTFVDGTSMAYSLPAVAGVEPGHSGRWAPVTAAALSRTMSCATPEEAFDMTMPLTAEDAAFVGADPVYVGTDVRVRGTGYSVVYIGTGQVAARS